MDSKDFCTPKRAISALGNYDECVKIVTIDEEDFTTLFRGQYCLVDVRTALPRREGFVSQYKIIEPLNNFTAKTPVCLLNKLHRASLI